jgi:hypothetical protein
VVELASDLTRKSSRTRKATSTPKDKMKKVRSERKTPVRHQPEETEEEMGGTDEYGNICNECGKPGGLLLCCDGHGCADVFHLDCAGVTKAPEGD